MICYQSQSGAVWPEGRRKREGVGNDRRWAAAGSATLSVNCGSVRRAARVGPGCPSGSVKSIRPFSSLPVSRGRWPCLRFGLAAISSRRKTPTSTMPTKGPARRRFPNRIEGRCPAVAPPRESTADVRLDLTGILATRFEIRADSESKVIPRIGEQVNSLRTPTAHKWRGLERLRMARAHYAQ